MTDQFVDEFSFEIVDRLWITMPVEDSHKCEGLSMEDETLNSEGITLSRLSFRSPIAEKMVVVSFCSNLVFGVCFLELLGGCLKGGNRLSLDSKSQSRSMWKTGKSSESMML